MGHTVIRSHCLSQRMRFCRDTLRANKHFQVNCTFTPIQWRYAHGSLYIRSSPIFSSTQKKWLAKEWGVECMLAVTSCWLAPVVTNIIIFEIILLLGCIILCNHQFLSYRMLLHQKMGLFRGGWPPPPSDQFQTFLNLRTYWWRKTPLDWPLKRVI